MGINVLNKKAILEFITTDVYLDIPDLMMQLSSAGKLVDCYQSKCTWLDIGRVDDYQLATELFETKRELFLKKQI